MDFRCHRYSFRCATKFLRCYGDEPGARQAANRRWRHLAIDSVSNGKFAVKTLGARKSRNAYRRHHSNDKSSEFVRLRNGFRTCKHNGLVW